DRDTPAAGQGQRHGYGLAHQAGGAGRADREAVVARADRAPGVDFQVLRAHRVAGEARAAKLPGRAPARQVLGGQPPPCPAGQNCSWPWVSRLPTATKKAPRPSASQLAARPAYEGVLASEALWMARPERRLKAGVSAGGLALARSSRWLADCCGPPWSSPCG